MKTLRGFIAGLVISSGAWAVAAPGDLVIESQEIECISAAQAACFADCAIAAGTWSGARADMTMARAERFNGCASGFRGVTVGNKVVAPADIPVSPNGKPVPVVGIVE